MATKKPLVLYGGFVKELAVTDNIASTGLKIKQTEVDFGTSGVSESSFVVTDADVSAATKITAEMSYEAPTGKDLDELEMDTFNIMCSANTGSFNMYIKSLEGTVADKFKINYILG